MKVGIRRRYNEKNLPSQAQYYMLLQFSQLLLTGMIIFGLGLLSQVIVIYLHHHLVLENLEVV